MTQDDGDSANENKRAADNADEVAAAAAAVTAADIRSLQDRKKLLDAQVPIATAVKNLVDILSEVPTLEILTQRDRERLDGIKTKLSDALGELRTKHGFREPIFVPLEEFVHDYVEDHWNTVFGKTSAALKAIPSQIVAEALRDWYKKDHRVREHLGAALEIHDAHRFSGFWRGAWGIGRRFPVVRRIASEASERKLWGTFDGSEIRVECQQRRAQRGLSMIQNLLTLGSAVFMIGMLLLGIWHLGYALSFGVRMDLVYRSTSFQARDAVWNNTLGLVNPIWKQEGEYWHANEGFTSSIDRERDWNHTAEGNSPVHRSGASQAMEMTLKALEIILVAPLPYLLMLGLGRYIKALAFRDKVDEYRAELLQFKGFEVALFIAIIAAAVVSRFLHNEDGLSWEYAVGATLVIAVLTAYFWLIESREDAAEKHHERQRRRRAKAKEAMTKKLEAHLPSR